MLRHLELHERLAVILVFYWFIYDFSLRGPPILHYISLFLRIPVNV
jgi:hypothetical protein